MSRMLDRKNVRSTARLPLQRLSGSAIESASSEPKPRERLR
jgi:hypothetical protein